MAESSKHSDRRTRRRWGIRQSEHRDVVLSFTVLLGILASHAVLETARDTLFLSALPPSRLPWVYVAIAVATLVVVWANGRALTRFENRRLMQATLVGAAAITVGFSFVAGSGEALALYGFYVWTGLLATVTVAQFWILLASRFNVASAKRAYAIVAAGGLVGATLGSAGAGFLLRFITPSQLLLVSPVICVGTAGVVALLKPAEDCYCEPGAAESRGTLGELLAHPYLRRLLALVIATTVTVTAVDITFKTFVAERVNPADLGEFFAIFYAAMNAIALLVQLFVVGRLVGALGVNRTLLILPMLLLISAGGFALTAAAAGVLLLKGFDSTLRHSLNRTSTEVLYVPVAAGLRARAKVFIDGFAARGAQAAAALGVLAAMELGAQPFQLAIAVGVSALIWLFLVKGLQRHYLELFREQLRRPSFSSRLQIFELDLNSLETLLEALNGEDERMVVNALELLDASGRTRLIPALILYHPSRDVVLRALEIFVAAERTDFVAIARRLRYSIEPELRAAALAACNAVAPDEAELREATADSSPRVRATAIVGLAAAGLCDEHEFREAVTTIARGESAEARLALARVIPGPDNDQLTSALELLAKTSQSSEGPEPELLAEVAATLGTAPRAEFMPWLLPMLENRTSRSAARDVFVALGEDVALPFLNEALRAPETAARIRLHIPRTISRLGGSAAAVCLLDHMRDAPDGRPSYKSLRGLGRMLANDSQLTLDREQVRSVALVAVKRALLLLAWRLNLERGAREDPARATQGSELLVQLLTEKEQNTIERVFRLFGLLNADEDFERIYRGMFEGDDRSRASSRELIEHLIDEPVRSAVLALADDTADSIRLLGADEFYKPLLLSYEQQLAAMLEDHSDTVQLLAAHHVGELGLVGFVSQLDTVFAEPASPLADVLRRAREVLGPNQEQNHAT